MQSVLEFGWLLPRSFLLSLQDHWETYAWTLCHEVAVDLLVVSKGNQGQFTKASFLYGPVQFDHVMHCLPDSGQFPHSSTDWVSYDLGSAGFC